jgi:hypothetical protein
MKLPPMTNALRAQIIVAVNALLALVTAFGLGLSDNQIGTISLAVNALLGVWVALTYKDSPKRIPDEPVPVSTGRIDTKSG